jgi:hypothetical protein
VQTDSGVEEHTVIGMPRYRMPDGDSTWLDFAVRVGQQNHIRVVFPMSRVISVTWQGEVPND